MNGIYASAKESPHASLHDAYQAARALGVPPLIATKKNGDGTICNVIPVVDNGEMLRLLRGSRSITELTSNAKLPFSTYYEQELGSRPPLDKVAMVWNGLGYDIRFVHPGNGTPVTSVSEDFTKLSQEQVVGLLHRYFGQDRKAQ